MTRMPGALWLPISRNYTNRRRARTNACILHVDAGDAHSLRGWFNNPAARASSHLHVRKDGVIEQYIDLDLISWASRQGDQRAVTVETQGRDGEPWTSAQLASLARILAFVNSHYGVPLTMMTNSRTATAGVGWHRLGIDGNFGGLPYPANLHRVSGGESWSGARGKTCPGTDRIMQIPNLIKTAAGTPPQHIPQKGQQTIMTTPDQFWDYNLRSRITGDNIKAGNMLRNIQRDSANTSGKVWNARNNQTDTQFGAHLRRGDLSLARFTSRVSGANISLATAALNAQEKATEARNLGRENRDMIRALASTLDEVLDGQGRILAAVDDAQQRVTIEADQVEVAVAEADEPTGDETTDTAQEDED